MFRSHRLSACTALLAAAMFAPLPLARPIVIAQATTKAPAVQSGNSDAGTSGTIASSPQQQTQTESQAGNTQPQANQGGAPSK